MFHQLLKTLTVSFDDFNDPIESRKLKIKSMNKTEKVKNCTINLSKTTKKILMQEEATKEIASLHSGAA
jgi:hypothetical protein